MRVVVRVVAAERRARAYATNSTDTVRQAEQ
jgi:hypothetical protein